MIRSHAGAVAWGAVVGVGAMAAVLAYSAAISLTDGTLDVSDAVATAGRIGALASPRPDEPGTAWAAISGMAVLVAVLAVAARPRQAPLGLTYAVTAGVLYSWLVGVCQLIAGTLWFPGVGLSLAMLLAVVGVAVLADWGDPVPRAIRTAADAVRAVGLATAATFAILGGFAIALTAQFALAQGSTSLLTAMPYAWVSVAAVLVLRAAGAGVTATWDGQPVEQAQGWMELSTGSAVLLAGSVAAVIVVQALMSPSRLQSSPGSFTVNASLRALVRALSAVALVASVWLAGRGVMVGSLDVPAPTSTTRSVLSAIALPLLCLVPAGLAVLRRSRSASNPAEPAPVPVSACPACSEAIAVGDAFCENCGVRLDAVEAGTREGSP